MFFDDVQHEYAEGEHPILPLVQQVDPVREHTADFLDVTSFYRLCRVAELENTSLVEDLDWYHSDGSTYDPDEEETDISSDNDTTDNSDEEEGEEDDREDGSSINSAGLDDNEPYTDSDADSEIWSVDSEEIAREVQDVAGELEEMFAFTGDFKSLGKKGWQWTEGKSGEVGGKDELPFIPTFVGQRFGELLLEDEP